ncbi:hypothetical protein C0J52_16309 [Blattella germanica]|nr:hypothetical protein C0J52_16309 [Blattella germanica]
MQKDATERPSWLTREFLEETLRTRDIFKDVIVSEFTVEPAVGKGENYNSVLFRVIVKFRHEGNNSEEETRLIMKVLPPVEFMAMWLTQLEAFEKETAIIGDVIPAMLRLLEEHSGGHKVFQPMSAYCYPSKVPHTLILEDLAITGCKLADRRSQLDLEHCCVVMKGLARFHAASVAINATDPSRLDGLKDEKIYIEKNKQIMALLMGKIVSAIAATVEKWDGFEGYAEKLKNVLPLMFDRLMEMVKPKANGLSVLNHGDCWVNNLLFHYSEDSGEVDGVRLIDFQLSRFASPALDLQYFMFTSPKQEVRLEKMNNLLEVYYKELCDTLKLLDQDSQQYSLQQLKEDFEENHFIGLLAACTVLSAVLTDPSDAVEMNKMEGDVGGIEVDDFMKQYSGQRFKTAFQTLLPYFEVKGTIISNTINAIFMSFVWYNLEKLCKNYTDATETPSWLTKNFLEETLRTRDIFKDVTVADFTVEPAVGKGENYTSLIYRVILALRQEGHKSEKETRLIMKLLPPVEFMAKILTEMETFQKETVILGDVIPAMSRLLDEKSAGGKVFQPMSSYCYHSKVPHTLILEDLAITGCKLADRRAQLDLEHCCVVMKGLARFHAASVAINATDPTRLDGLKEEQMYIEKNREMMGSFIGKTVTAITETVRKWDGFENYSEKMKHVLPTMFDRMMEMVRPKANGFSVLNHGDCWVNNLLFHYSEDTGEVDGVRLIDFQLSRFASPALDLQYFMFTSPKQEVRLEKMDHLLEVYHKELCETLKLLDQDPYQFTLQQLKDEYEEKHFFGLITACTVLSAVLTDPSDAVEMKKIKSDGTGIEVEDMLKPYSGHRFKTVFQSLLPYFEKKIIGLKEKSHYLKVKYISEFCILSLPSIYPIFMTFSDTPTLHLKQVFRVVKMQTDATERPSWLTREFLEETLRTRDIFKDVIVLDFSVEPAVGKGENYTSLIYRIIVKLRHEGNNSEEETRLIMKTLPPVEFTVKWLTEMETFKREISIIGHVMPAMLRLLEKKSAGGKVFQPMSAYCYHSKVPHTLILEDLAITGCKLVDRRSQLDLEHCSVVMKGLARFHAASVAINATDPSSLDGLKNEQIYIEKYKEFMEAFFSKTVTAITETIEKWDGFGKYSEKIKNVLPNMFERMIPKANGFSVLNHGDCWVNNMLFHYSEDTGEVDGVRLIDFQVSRFASPALDLQYFMFTSPKNEVRLEKMDYLLEVYHKELCDTLKLLDQDPKQFTLQQLKDEYADKYFFGLITACTGLSAALVDPSDVVDVKKVKEDGSGIEVEDMLKPLDKIRQDNNRQDKTRQGKTRQEKTRQYKTRKDKKRKDKIRQKAIKKTAGISVKMQTDATERPSWLTKDFLEETLRTRDIFKDVVVSDFTVEPAVGKGENYTSLIYRVILKLRHQGNNSEEETRLIMKVLPPVEFMAKWLTEMETFQKEISIIGHVMPAMLRLLEKRSAGGKVFQPMSAYCYHSKIPHTLILEDLAITGCKVADRRAQLDLEHCCVVMKGLARFHAASVAINATDPSLLDGLKEEQIYIEKYREVMDSFIGKTVTAITETIEKWDGFGKYSEKIKNVLPSMFERMMEMVRPKANGFSVLNHGDCWVNNMLFHYSEDTGEVDGVRLIDFQLSRFASPALDLQYFMFTSPKQEVRFEKMDHLLEVYHKELCDTLKLLDQDPKQFTLQQLKDEYEEKHFFGFITACTVLSAVLADPSDAVEMKKVKEDGSGIEVEDLLKPYSGHRFKTVFQSLLPYFESKDLVMQLLPRTKMQLEPTMGSTVVDEDLAVPQWLTNAFLSEVLSKEKSAPVSVIDFDAKAAVPKGDNYLSTLYRIVATYKGQDGVDKSYLIVKTLPAGEMMQKFLSELKGYEKEAHMYQVVFPAIYRIMKETYGKIHLLSARSLPCPIEKTFVLEDLQHLGYKMADRCKGLDLDHCKVSVRALAKLHAMSLKLRENDPKMMDVYKESFYRDDCETKDKIKLHFDMNMKTLASKVEQWQGYEHFADKIRKLIPTAPEIMVEQVKPREGGFNVLNHGDCWVNNMLFHYCPDTGKVDGVRLIDFQIARFSSAALDLQYFICTSPNDEVRFHQRDALLQEYHREVCEVLKALGLESEAISLQQLKEEFEEKEMFGFMNASTILCAILAQKEEVPDFKDFKEEDFIEPKENPMEKTFSGAKYRDVYQKMLLYYDKKGLL